MRLTLMTDYALRQLMYVAEHPERLCTITEIAAAHEISRAHLMKITHQLSQAGWLETVRGKGGGMRLAMAPQAINLAAVVQRIEPDFKLVECFSEHSRCRLTQHCRLATVLDGAMQQFSRYLQGYTLADLLDQTHLSLTSAQPVHWS